MNALLLAAILAQPVAESDLARFPGAEESQAAYERYAKHVPTIEAHVLLNADVPAFQERWKAWQNHCAWRRDCWDKLDNAHRARKATDGQYGQKTAAEWLAALRDLLGDDAYQQGWMPPATPEK